MSDNGSFLDKLRGLLGGDKPAEDAPGPPSIKIPEVKVERPSPSRVDPALQPPEQSGVDTVYLRQQISNFLNIEQIYALAAQLDIDSTTFDGGKGRQVLQLIQACERQGKVPELLAACRAIAPEVKWQRDWAD